MIDLHCHILYGLDDGPGTIEESVQMCRWVMRWYKDSCGHPHTLNESYQNDRLPSAPKVQEPKEALKQFGANDPQSEICLHWPRHSTLRIRNLARF
jgi:protein-tyrosine phosphatase